MRLQQKWNLSKEIRRGNRVCWARACRNLPGPPVNVVLVSRLGLGTRRSYKDRSGSLRRRTVGDAARMVHPSLQYFLTFLSRRLLCSCLSEDQMSAVLNKSIAPLSRPSTLHRSFNLTVNFEVFSQRGQKTELQTEEIWGCSDVIGQRGRRWFEGDSIVLNKSCVHRLERGGAWRKLMVFLQIYLY